MLDFQSNDYNFPIDTQPVFTQDGEVIPDHKCIIRTDTGKAMGLHGSRYKAIPHDDVVNSILDSVKASNLSSDYDLNVDVIEGGRKLRGQILFKDLVQEPAVGDYVQFRVSFYNSYDGSWPLGQRADGFRLWCLNGCTSPDAIAMSRLKHTTSINVDGSAAKIITGAEMFMNKAEEWQAFMKVRINSDQVEQFFRSTICKVTTKQKQVTKTNEKQLENLISGWQEESATLGHNKWALYNCLTSWATHTEDLRAPEVARYNREAMISSAMNHNLWNTMNTENVL